MQRSKKAPPPDLAVAAALDAAALAVFELRDRPGGLYAEAPGAFYFFLAAALLISLAMSHSRSIAWFRAWAGLWLFLFLMLTYQFGLYAECRILAMLGFLSLLARREAFPASLVLCLSASASAAIVYALDAREELAPAAQAAAGLIGLGSVLGLASAFLCGLSRHRERARLLEAEEREAKDVMRRLAEAQLGYLEFARTAGRRSSTDERNRLSAELHDTIGYTLTNLEMILEAGADLVDADREKLKDLLETGLSQVRASMIETRRALYLIRSQEDRLLFLNAVQELASVFGKTTGMEVSIDYGAFPRACGEEIESALYHFIQEGLVNAFSHGRAKRVKVYLGVDPENLRVSIIDDGIGAQEIVEGIGILGMRERFGRLGGTISIELPVDGFKITATVPTGG
jgi:Signal transduction histidine kinase